MNMVRILIGLGTAVLLAGPAAAQKVSYDVGNTNFESLKTFAFKNSPVANSTTDTSGYDSPLIAERTQEAIAAQLEARGLKRDDAHPDMYVSMRRTYKTNYSTYVPPEWGMGYGWGWGYGPWYSVNERVMGTLVVDVVNAATGQLLWRGVAEKHVHEHARPEERIERVNEEVDKIFDKFPR
jgi:Domain of unknown function (DUF4136)